MSYLSVSPDRRLSRSSGSPLLPNHWVNQFKGGKPRAAGRLRFQIVDHCADVKDAACRLDRTLNLDTAAKLNVRIEYRDEMNTIVRVGWIPNQTGIRTD